MEIEARHHHYIPQCYLRGFANKKGKNWFVIASDLGSARTYSTNVRNVCGERDFMRFESPGQKSSKLESEMGDFEGRVCEAIRNITRDGKFDGENRNLVLNLMALLAVRSPEQRENMRNFHERKTKLMLDLMLETQERWEGQIQQMKASGVSVENSTTYEQARKFHERGAYRVEVPRESHIATEFELQKTVLKLLGNRLWTLYTCSGKYGEFVTTNRPVVIVYNEPEKVPAYLSHSPGFGLTNTEVFFPLTRHGFLIGRWDRGDRTEVSQQSFIASANTDMMSYSYGQVFSPAPQILHCDSSAGLHWDANYLKRMTGNPAGGHEVSSA